MLGSKTYQTLCGAHIWVDWSIQGDLKDKLFEYVGSSSIKGVPCYQFIPYKRPGYPAIFDMDALMRVGYTPFRPFLIDTGRFNELTDYEPPKGGGVA